MFNEATQNIYKISYDEKFTERRVISDMIVQHDVRSARRVNSPKCLIFAHQTRNRIYTLSKNINVAIFDNLVLCKYYVELDGQRYQRDGVLINYEENDYIKQCKGLKLFFIGFVGEEIFNLFVSYPDVETKFPITILGLGLQHDHKTLKQIELFQEYGDDPDNARLFLILTRRRKIELKSDGKKLIVVKNI